MANRAEPLLHRWLPLVAAASAAVFVLIHAVVFPLINSVERDDSAAAAAADLAVRGPSSSPTMLPALVVANARSVLDRAATATTSLDGDPLVVETIARLVAENDTIQRLWVINDAGSVVYFGKERPPQAAVEGLAPDDVYRLLQGLPQGLLLPDQRLAILAHAAVQGRRGRSGEWADIPPAAGAYSEVRRIPGGWIAIAAHNPGPPTWHPPGINNTRTAVYRELSLNLSTICIALYWLSLPAWVTLDALRRRERAPIWGIFTLVGNVIGLIVYLLARREP